AAASARSWPRSASPRSPASPSIVSIVALREPEKTPRPRAIEASERESGEPEEAADIAHRAAAHARVALVVADGDRHLAQAGAGGERLDQSLLNVIVVVRRTDDLEHAPVHAPEAARQIRDRISGEHADGTRDAGQPERLPAAQPFRRAGAKTRAAAQVR